MINLDFRVSGDGTNVQMWAYCRSRKTRFTNEEKKEINYEPQISGLTKYVNGNITYQKREI